MVFNYRFPQALIGFLLFFCSLVHAQEGGYFLDTSGDQPRFFQRLYWYEEEYALFYEVVIQREDGEYQDFLRESTVETFISVSLPSGKYRYGVIPRDLLGQVGQMSEWRTFEVIAAFQPSLEKFYPPSFLLDKNLKRVLDVAGDNLLEESEIYLRGEENSLFPIARDVSDRKRIKLFFDDETLIPGNYDLYVRNPGGLETIMEGFMVMYSKPIDLFLKFSWVSALPIYGEMYDVFGSTLYMTGAALNLEAVASKRSSFNGGMEISMAGHALNSALSFQTFGEWLDSFSEAETGASWFEVNLNILLQKQFFQKLMIVTFRFGLGVSFFNLYGEDPQGGYTSDELMVIHWNLGLSYMLRLFDVFHVDIGVDFSQYNITPEASGFIKPRLSLCWKF